MPDPFPLDSNELTPEDLDVVRAFLETNDFATSASSDDMPGSSTISAMGKAEEEAEVLTLFVTEVDEDLEEMRRALALMRQVGPPDDQSRALSLSRAQAALRRSAHKIHGVSATIGCNAMSTIADAIETLVDMIRSQHTDAHTGLLALDYSIEALRETLESVVIERQESILPLLSLEEHFAGLHLPLRQIDRADLPGKSMEDIPEAVPISTSTSMISPGTDQASIEKLAPSSLVARILQESVQRTGHPYQPRPLLDYTPQLPVASAPALEETMPWEELELDNITEAQTLIRSLNDAIADVASATSRLQQALSRFDT